MKTGAMMKMCSALVALTLAGSVCLAAPYRGDYRGDRGDRGHFERGGGRSEHRYSGGSHYGYYHDARGDLVFGLIGLGILAAVVSADRPVYVQPAPVYVQSAPVVVQQPQVIYVQQPRVVPQPVVIQQEPPQPVMVTINIQNSNGSYTPVTLRPAGSQWVGPRGEYYDAMPTVGQLRQVYGF